MDIAVIGCGHMGSSMARKLARANTLFVYDVNCKKAEALANEIKHHECKTVKEALEKAQIVILAIKPQSLSDCASEIAPLLNKDHQIISVLAGTSISILRQALSHQRCVRMMPNLSIMYGEGVIGLCKEELTAKEIREIEEIFTPLGSLHWIAEKEMDAFTSLVGSGPAFFFSMVESMIKAGKAMGFSQEIAQQLVMQMLQGSLTMLKRADKTCEQLIQAIASPGGTTMAGLEEYKRSQVKEGIEKVFLAACEKSKELSKVHPFPKKNVL